MWMSNQYQLQEHQREDGGTGHSQCDTGASNFVSLRNLRQKTWQSTTFTTSPSGLVPVLCEVQLIGSCASMLAARRQSSGGAGGSHGQLCLTEARQTYGVAHSSGEG